MGIAPENPPTFCARAHLGPVMGPTMRSLGGDEAVATERELIAMKSKKNSRSAQSARSSQVEQSGEAVPAMMVPANESAWSASRVVQSQLPASSRQRMLEARGDLLHVERDYINISTQAEAAMHREAEAMDRQAAQLRADAWAIEQESETRIRVLQAQARMEGELAKRITEIAERSALAVLDRIKEASDSMMDWAGLMGGDLSDMLKKEAAEQVARKVADIEAVEEAMEDEARALELIELSARYKNGNAA